jgi:hypothetical protein
LKSKTKLRWWPNLRVAAGYHEPLEENMPYRYAKEKLYLAMRALSGGKGMSAPA